MQSLFSVFFYVLTGIGILSSLLCWLSDIRLDGKRFVWYYYLPCSSVNTLLGTLSPHIFVLWICSISGKGNVWAGLGVLLYGIAILGNNLIFFFLFFRKEHFSRSFYWSLGMTGLFVLSYWLIRLIF